MALGLMYRNIKQNIKKEVKLLQVHGLNQSHWLSDLPNLLQDPASLWWDTASNQGDPAVSSKWDQNAQ